MQGLNGSEEDVKYSGLQVFLPLSIVVILSC
jgi:hypothetical protein